MVTWPWTKRWYNIDTTAKQIAMVWACVVIWECTLHGTLFISSTQPSSPVLQLNAYDLSTTYDCIFITRSSSTSRDRMPDEVHRWRERNVAIRYSFCVLLCYKHRVMLTRVRGDRSWRRKESRSFCCFIIPTTRPSSRRSANKSLCNCWTWNVRHLTMPSLHHVSKTTSHRRLAITLTHMNGFWYFLAEMLPIK